MNQLETAWRRRMGRSVGAASQSERNWLDFLVDGASLHATLAASDLDLIGGFGWGAEEGRRLYANRLLLREPSELESGRVALFVCAECGDIGCGALTARVIESAGGFQWKDFGYENNYDPAMSSFEEYSSVGPFFFERPRYLSVMETAGSALLES